MNELYHKFEKCIDLGTHILDLGSGSGRDSKYFYEKGYKVTAIDPSSKMCEATKKIANVPVYTLTAQKMRFENEFGGIWACASLLHVSYDQMNVVLENISKALICGGILYSSWKKGDGENRNDGRVFYDMTEKKLVSLLYDFPEFEIIEIWETIDKREDKQRRSWINLLVKKR